MPRTHTWGLLLLALLASASPWAVGRTCQAAELADRLAAAEKHLADGDYQQLEQEWEQLDRDAATHAELKMELARWAKDKDRGKFSRYLASLILSGVGRPSRLGPAEIRDTELKFVIHLVKHANRAGIDHAHIELTPDLERLKVSAAAPEWDNPPMQILLWHILGKHDLSFTYDEKVGLRISRE